jgi:hypothetical protein
VTPKRVYYVPCSKSGSASLHVLDLGSRRDRPLGKLDRFAGYLAVSPDQRTILYQRLNRVSGDLMLVENFR